ncbi:hypothetical protein J7I93_22135 [Bacillus sp. ISL-47]|uniref:hypothetical protein n=1 Tax=Bacillus sp. ISL-47 TaxID=2819130 RepID=UPI001BE9CFCA|nr:hypothetical protein [Bacillus sp. ISL-47]MBT2690843.1 hypothetical protein [Bacillus sp. ISL-47]MBT2710801.1 hypothetical protein [Pseudomonas sp. ISL-84]
METLLEVIREVMKGVVREIAAHTFRKNVLDNKKTTPRRRKHLRGEQLVPYFINKYGYITFVNYWNTKLKEQIGARPPTL